MTITWTENPKFEIWIVRVLSRFKCLFLCHFRENQPAQFLRIKHTQRTNWDFLKDKNLSLAALLIGSQFYESWWRDEALQSQICACDQKEIKFTETEVQVILLRYSMHLIPGIGAGIWICTPKTFNIWRNVLVCRRKVPMRSNGISSGP